ncbi:MAG: hypothetical protein JRN35_10375 [Nitrososphaerota archaeon]|nr:hypothetical protein [Nitrososphaerota archaeon]
MTVEVTWCEALTVPSKGLAAVEAGVAWAGMLIPLNRNKVIAIGMRLAVSKSWELAFIHHYLPCRTDGT